MRAVDTGGGNGFEEHIACDSLVFDLGRDLRHVVAVHHDIMLFRKRHGAEPDFERLLIAGCDVWRQFEFSARKNDLPGFFPVDIDCRPRLELLDIEQDLFPLCAGGNSETAAIPGRVPAGRIFHHLRRQQRLK